MVSDILMEDTEIIINGSIVVSGETLCSYNGNACLLGSMVILVTNPNVII